MPGKSSVPSRKRATATSSAAMSAAVARDPMAPASRAMRRAGKRRSSGARNSSRPAATRSGGAAGDGSRRGWVSAYWIGSAHVRRPELSLERPVAEEDGRVDERLGVDDHVDPVVGHAVEPVGLHDLEPLVGQRRGVDRDLRAHRPGRMAQRRCGSDRGERLERRVEERPARRRQDQAVDVVHRLAGKALPDRRVLRVDRPQPAQRRGQGIAGVERRPFGGPGLGLRHHQVAAGNERLLVGGRDDLACAERGEDRPQAHDPAGARPPRDPRRRRGERLERARPTAPGRSPPAGRGGTSEPIAARRGRRRRTCSSSSAACEPVAIATTSQSGREGGEDVDRLPSRSSHPSRGGRRGPAGATLADQPCTRATQAARTGAANRIESTRSRIPPCPGRSVPESLTPAARLSSDSARSPDCATTPRRGPRIKASSGELPLTHEDERDDHGGHDEAAEDALQRLLRGDPGQERAPPDRASDEVGARIEAPDPGQEDEDPAPLRPEDPLERRRIGPLGGEDRDRAEKAHVESAEHRRRPGGEPVGRVAPGEGDHGQDDRHDAHEGDAVDGADPGRRDPAPRAAPRGACCRGWPGAPPRPRARERRQRRHCG